MRFHPLRVLARFVLWLTDELCEYCHHFNLTPDGYPGCIGNWRWFGFGPNRWQAWAYDLLYPESPLAAVLEPPLERRAQTAGSGATYTYTWPVGNDRRTS